MSARRLRTALGALLTAALLLGGCLEHDIRDPDDFTPASTPIPDDPVLGPRLYTGSKLRDTYVSMSMRSRRGYVSVYEGEGWNASLRYVEEGFGFFTFDPITGEGEQVEAPPLPPSRNHYFAAPADPNADAGLLIVGHPMDDGYDFARYEGDAWTVYTGPPGVAYRDLTIVQFRGSATMVQTGSEVWYGDGRSWRRLEVPGGEVGFGPWDESDAVVVFTGAEGLCAAWFANATLSSGGSAPTETTCSPVPTAGLAGSPRNGTPDDFQVLLESSVTGYVRGVHFLARQPVRGTLFRAHQLVGAPGTSNPVALVDPPPTSAPGGVSTVPRLRRVIAGGAGSFVLDGFPVRTECACDRNTDRTCRCVARDVTYAQWGIDSAAERLGILSLDDVGGRRTLHVRIIPLPEGDPLPGPAVCTSACSTDYSCEVDPADGESRCLPLGTADTLHTAARVYVTPADTLAYPAVSVSLSSTARECTARRESGSDEHWRLDGFCSYTLDASADGHVPLRITDIPTGEEGTSLTLGPYVLARGGLVSSFPSLLPGATRDRSGLVVRPGGGAMYVRAGDSWYWIEASTAAPGFTAAPIAPAHRVANPRFVTPNRALLPIADDSIALVEGGTIVSTLAGWHDLPRAAIARNARRAIVPAGERPSPLLASQAKLVAFDGAGLEVIATAPYAGRGHAISADGTRGAFFTTGGDLHMFSAAGTLPTPRGSWSRTSRLRVALGPDDEYIVIGPRTETTTTNPCSGITRCQLFAFEDLARDFPTDPILRDLLPVTDRALWGEIGATTRNIAWLELDTSTRAHLYHRDATTGLRTEIPLGTGAVRDFGHVIVDDTVIVLTPTSAIVLDLVSGTWRAEPGTYAVPPEPDLDPAAQVDDEGRVWLRESRGEFSYYTPATGTFTRLGTAYPRFGVANDRWLFGDQIYRDEELPGGRPFAYSFGAPMLNVDDAYRTHRVRGAPCLLYWRRDDAFDGLAMTRRWYCTD